VFYGKKNLTKATQKISHLPVKLILRNDTLYGIFHYRRVVWYIGYNYVVQYDWKVTCGSTFTQFCTNREENPQNSVEWTKYKKKFLNGQYYTLGLLSTSNFNQ